MAGEYKWVVWVTETSLAIFCVSIDHNCFYLFINIHVWMVSFIIATYTISLISSPIYKHLSYHNIHVWTVSWIFEIIF